MVDLGAAARHVSDELRGLTSGQMSFYGHSMGAIIAFESARIVHGADPARVNELVRANL